MDTRLFGMELNMFSELPGDADPAASGSLVWLILDVTPHGPRVGAFPVAGVFSSKATALDLFEKDIAAQDPSRLTWVKAHDESAQIVVNCRGRDGHRDRQYVLCFQVVDEPDFKRMLRELGQSGEKAPTPTPGP